MHDPLYWVTWHEDCSAGIRTLTSIVKQLEPLPGGDIGQLRINILDKFALNGRLDVSKDLMILHAVQLPAELLESSFSAQGAEPVVFEVGLTDVLRHDGAICLAQLTILVWGCTPK